MPDSLVVDAVLVTVIMPCFNAITWLEDAVTSVLSQDHRALELLVMDGGSTDGTLVWLTDAAKRDARLQVLSEPDSGPAAALNKGLRRARGVYVGWLNADDLYTEGAISAAVARLQAVDAPVLVYGDGVHMDANGSQLRDYATRPPPVAVQEFLNGCFICQPTVFFRRSLIFTTGLLDESLKTAFDFEYWIRVFLGHKARIAFVPRVQAYSRWHENALSARLRSTVAAEALLILRRHLHKAPLHWAFTYLLEISRSSHVDPHEVVLFSRTIADLVSDDDYVDYMNTLVRYADTYPWAKSAVQHR